LGERSKADVGWTKNRGKKAGEISKYQNPKRTEPRKRCWGEEPRNFRKGAGGRGGRVDPARRVRTTKRTGRPDHKGGGEGKSQATKRIWGKEVTGKKNGNG